MIRFLILAPVSLLAGAAAAWLFRTLPAPGVGRTLGRIVAHLLEFHLFIDEPSVVFRAQRDLLRENLLLLRQIAFPAVCSALLFGALAWMLDPYFGRAPLPAGEPFVVTAHASTPDDDIRLDVPAAVSVESPAVHLPATQEIVWRIRPASRTAGPFAARRPDGARVAIGIPWPRAQILSLDWLAWFFLFAAFSAGLSAAFFRRVATPLLLLLLLPSAHAATTPVILISVDTLRADRLSSYGFRGQPTPGIDSYATGSTVFTAIDAQIPVTLPSHTVLMTSRMPFATGVENNTHAVPSGVVTLASVLREQGYHTGAFVGSVVLDKSLGLDRGFDTYDSPFQASLAGTGNPYQTRLRRDAALVTRAARQWMEKNRSGPFFAFLHLYDLHTPYPLPGVAALKPAEAPYLAQLRRVDEVLGSFRDQLVRTGLWDGALVILLSDHGESLGDHGESGHGYFIYESTLHVPLIVHWPAGAAPSADAARTGGLIDVAPTILDYLHIPAPPAFTGRSLLLSTAGGTFAESVYTRDNFGWAPLRALRDGALKYIDAPRPEFYDLVADPGERRNVLATRAREAGTMKTRLSALLTSAPLPPAPRPVSPRTKEMLQSLGYTSGGAASASSAIDPKDRIAEDEAFENGLALLTAGNYREAIALLKSVFARDSRNIPALTAEAEAYLRSGDASRAVALWNQAIALSPGYRPAAESLGSYWLSRHDTAKGCPLAPQNPECSRAAPGRQ